MTDYPAPMPPTNSSPRVLVIGGGVAGCVAALFLRRLGLTPVVFEAYPEGKLATNSGGLQIAPNGMRVLQFLGLNETLAARGAPVTRYLRKNHLGEVLVTTPIVGVDTVSGGDLPAVVVTRAKLHQTVVEAVRAVGVEVHYSKRLSTIIDTGEDVSAVFADGSRETGSFLIGADGLHSMVRHLIFPEAPPPLYLGLVAYSGFVPRDYLTSVSSTLPQPGELGVMWGPLGVFGLGVGGADSEGRATLLWWSNFPQGEVGHAQPIEEFKARTSEEIRDQLLSLQGDWVEPIPSVIAAACAHPTACLTRRQLHEVDHTRLPHWHAGRCVLIGDAAHAMSPNGGQGASQALEDCMILAKLLRANGVTRGSDTSGGDTIDAHVLEHAFARFQAVRKPRVDHIASMMVTMSNARRNPLGPWWCWLRDRLIRLAGAIGDKFLAQYIGYKIEWEGEEPA